MRLCSKEESDKLATTLLDMISEKSRREQEIIAAGVIEKFVNDRQVMDRFRASEEVIRIINEITDEEFLKKGVSPAVTVLAIGAIDAVSGSFLGGDSDSALKVQKSVLSALAKCANSSMRFRE